MHGCIRLGDVNVAALFLTVKIGTPVTIIYAPVLLAQLDDGGLFVEMNPDKDALERKDGLAREVTILRVARGQVGGLDATSHPIASLKSDIP